MFSRNIELAREGNPAKMSNYIDTGCFQYLERFLIFWLAQQKQEMSTDYFSHSNDVAIPEFSYTQIDSRKVPRL